MRLDVRDLAVSPRPAVSFAAAAGDVVAVLGPNGTGKSSLLRAIAGEVRAAGDVLVDGQSLNALPAHQRVRAGVTYISAERDVFASLSVDENLQLFGAGAGDARAAVFEVFPQLAELRGQRASTLSGGEQQMLAMARAVAQEPRVLLADEPAAGLSPKLVDDLYRSVLRAAARGAVVVLAEQHVGRAMRVASSLVQLGDRGAGVLAR
jgi:branched-chain amino acid transport system ATP-binding protein